MQINEKEKKSNIVISNPKIEDIENFLIASVCCAYCRPRCLLSPRNPPISNFIVFDAWVCAFDEADADVDPDADVDNFFVDIGDKVLQEFFLVRE